MSARRRSVHHAVCIAAGALIALTTITGCARHGSGEQATNKLVITREELEDPRVVGTTVMEAIRTLRPMFLMDAATLSKGAAAVLEASINGGRLRPLADLTGLPVAQAAEIRFLSIGEAQQRFGVRARMGPVILVTLRGAGPADPEFRNLSMSPSMSVSMSGSPSPSGELPV